MTKVQKSNQKIQEKPSWSVRTLYGYFSVPMNRKMMLNKIDKGLGFTSNIGDLPEFDIKEDEISKEVLTNWKKLPKKERQDYCRFILDNSVLGQTWAYKHKDDLLQKIKNKVMFWKGGDKDEVKKD